MPVVLYERLCADPEDLLAGAEDAAIRAWRGRLLERFDGLARSVPAFDGAAREVPAERTPMLKEAIAFALAGIVGTIANGLAIALVVAPERIDLLLVPGRYAVAILVAASLPLLFRRLAGAAPWAAALVVLTLVPSLLAKLVFGAGAPWHLVLALNAVYALAAIATYRLVARSKRNQAGTAG